MQLLSSLPFCIAAQNLTEEQQFNIRRTLSVGYIIFPGFTALDVFGPLEIFYQVCASNLTLSTISYHKGPVSSHPPPHRMGDAASTVMEFGSMIGTSVTATHTFEDAPALDVIIVPGGLGDFTIEQGNDTRMEDFLVRRFDAADYILSVCVGSATLARAGLLEGRRATTNKALWSWAVSHGKNVTWVPSARWVQDGKIWTSSGVAAGIDMTYAFLKHAYGAEIIDGVMNGIEYAPHADPSWDPFSVVHNVPGADKNRPLTDCIAPAGYSA
ncbi:class I glutamine amidotransferase-like protein [Thozetella sp. PMI_491]|nr:class I glutamine amidotransferase-like protein [Thozetella sp. PMI_491]